MSPKSFPLALPRTLLLLCSKRLRGEIPFCFFSLCHKLDWHTLHVLFVLSLVGVICRGQAVVDRVRKTPIKVWFCDVLFFDSFHVTRCLAIFDGRIVYLMFLLAALHYFPRSSVSLNLQVLYPGNRKPQRFSPTSCAATRVSGPDGTIIHSFVRLDMSTFCRYTSMSIA